MSTQRACLSSIFRRVFFTAKTLKSGWFCSVGQERQGRDCAHSWHTSKIESCNDSATNLLSSTAGEGHYVQYYWWWL